MDWYASYLEDEDLYNAALGSCLEMIKTGTTCCIEWLTQPGQEEMSIRAVSDIGIRAVMGICAMDRFEPSAGAQPGFESSQENTEECLERVESFIKNHHNAMNGRIKAWINLLQTSNSSDELCKTAGLAFVHQACELLRRVQNQNDAANLVIGDHPFYLCAEQLCTEVHVPLGEEV